MKTWLPIAAVIDNTLTSAEPRLHEVEGQKAVLIETVLQPAQNQNESHKLMEF